MKKNPHDRILKGKLNEQHLNTVLSFAFFNNISVKKKKDNKVTYINYKLFQIKMHLYAAT